MIIFLVFLLISLLAILNIDKKYENRYLFVSTLLISILSLIPSLSVPYLYDDIDILYSLSKSSDISNTFQWLMVPHNEHILPVFKIFYLIFYKTVGINPIPFHILAFFTYWALLFLTYKLLLLLTNNKYSAFFAITLLSGCNLLDNVFIITTNLAIIFYLLFLLLTLFAQYQFYSSEKNYWAIIAFLGTLLSPLCFSLGVFNLLYSFLFEKLCIPYHKRKHRSLLFIIFIAWAFSVSLYALNAEQILLAKHYQNIHKASALETIKPLKAIKYLILSLGTDTIPKITRNNLLSFAILFSILLASIKKYRYIPWKKIFFFVSWGIPLSFLMFTFRISWGKVFLSFARYDVIPVFMLCCILALLSNTITVEMKKPLKFLFIFLCFSIIIYGNTFRYKRSSFVAIQTKETLGNFNAKFRLIFKQYFQANPNIKQLIVKDDFIFFPFLNSIQTKKGLVVNITRENHSFSFYAQYLLPKEVRDKILWTSSLDKKHWQEIVIKSDNHTAFLILNKHILLKQ